MKRIFITLLAVLSIATMLAKDSYLPICTPGRDYTYTNGKYTLDLSTITSEHSGYVWFDREELFPYSNRLREEGSLVLKYFPKYKKESGWIEKAEENFTTTGSDFVYFDYNLQVGDTLCVVDMTQYDDKEIYGRIIKVLSIDSVEIGSLNRLRYNLESRNFYASIWEKHDDEYHFSKVTYNTPYNDSWIEGIGYTNYNFDRNTLGLYSLYDSGTLIYGEENVDENTYLSTCIPLREYIYYHEQGGRWLEMSFLSEKFPGYTAHNYDSYGSKVLREQGAQILRNFDGLTTTPELIKLLNENLPTVNDDFVYFDYNLQIGDTLCVVESTATAVCEYEMHILDGKIIKVLSVDTIELGMQSQLKYNLESRPFIAVLSMYYDAALPPEERVYEYNYGIDIGKTYSDAWIEGIGYTSIVFPDDLDANLIHKLQCVFEEGELIYCADGADCNGLSDRTNKKIDFATLTLHRNGDALMAVFPTAQAGEAITLYDATGRAVATQTVRQGATTATIDVATLPAGVYIARLNSGATAKVVL
ncbi:MAG: T9SS type A sorting domain-containing protein [Bacteroidaceae bacterium]|nr:T9SS type A sorting domain-containing protein [Bacteroidaceae bacterium]